MNRNLTLNVGLRLEYENGIKEAQDRAHALVRSERARSRLRPRRRPPTPPTRCRNCRPASSRWWAAASTRARPGMADRTWKPEALWMPRVSFGYKLGEKNVLKGGYGMYYDTLNARDWTPNQDGFNVTTTNPLSNDFGLTWALGDPKNGILPLAIPFPVRASTGSAVRNRPGQRARAATTCWAAASPPRTPTGPTRACSGGASAAARSSARGWPSRSPTPARTPTGRASRSARTTCPSSTWSGANVRDTTANDFLTDERDEPVLHRDRHRALTVLRCAPGLRSAAGPAAAGIDDVHVARPSSGKRLLRAFPQMATGLNAPSTTTSRSASSSPTRSSSS